MNDKDLYELCVSSGFAESEWWPKKPDDNYELAFHREHGWIWIASPFSSGSCEPENARARILAALVEWGVSNDKWVNLENDMSQVRSFGGDDVTQPYHKGEPVVALLNCFSQWRAAQ